MNTTEKGNKFEDQVLSLLMKDIKSFSLSMGHESHVKVFKKKKYYSRFRKGYIEFDIAIEVYRDKNIPNYSSLILVECKDYKKAVGVDQINKFLQDVRDLSEGSFTHGLKPIMAISSRLAKSAYNIALERNVGLIKISDTDGLKWVLNRSFGKYGINQALSSESIFVDGENPKYYSSHWFFYGNNMWFSNIKEYIGYITGEHKVNFRNDIEYFSKGNLEDLAKSILENINYLEGSVSIDDLLSYEILNNIKLHTDITASMNEKNLLGRVDFESNEIFIYKNDVEDEKRDRFTLAHEISQIILGHGRYLDKDSLEESDLADLDILDNSMVAKLEFQANYLAGCLLVPEKQLVKEFLKIYSELGLVRRGIFWVYLDNQPDNKLTANNIISKLARYFNVSKSVIRIRLIGFGLLHDARIKVI